MFFWKKGKKKYTNTYFNACIICIQKKGATKVTGRGGCVLHSQNDKCHLQALAPRVSPSTPEKGSVLVLGNENVPISWLSRAGGACTCHRGMWTLWFNPGTGSWGPCSEGQRGAQHSWFFKSKGKTVVD